MYVRLRQLFMKSSTGKLLLCFFSNNLSLFSKEIFLICGQFSNACSSRKLLKHCSESLTKAMQLSSVTDGFTNTPNTLVKSGKGMNIFS